MRSMTSKVLRGGIIGCGFFSQFHVDAWRAMPGVELIAACDVDPARAQQAAPHSYASLEQMLDSESLDFVDIATRPESHLALVRTVAAHGLPMICQKPLAPSWDEAVAIADAADSAGVRMMVHENWRWQPWYRAARELIRNGDIGSPLTYRFRTVKADGAGENAYPAQPYFRDYPRLLIYETLVHHLDTARFLFGEVSHLYAQARTNNPRTKGEDEAHLMLTHASGLIGTIDGHRFLDADGSGPVLGEAWFEGDADMLYLHSSGDLRLGSKTVWKNEVVSGYRGDSVRATQQHFIDCLISGETFETDVKEYLKTVALVEAAYQSVKERAAVSPVSMNR